MTAIKKNFKNLNILHYVSAFSLPSETFIYDLINNLEENGIENYVLTHNRHLEDERPFKKVKVTSENVSFSQKVYCKLFKQWQIRNEKDVLTYIKEIRPDIIHAHFGPNGIRIYNLIKKYDLNIPLVISFHGMDINVLPLKDKIYFNNLLKINQDNNITFISPSRFLKSKMVSLGFRSNIVNIIPNAYNSYFENVEKEKYWECGDVLKLLNIGRFEEVKGQKYLIKSFFNILKQHPNTTLTLIGYGCLEDELKKQCKDLGIADKVIFLKQVEHSKLPEIIISHDVYIQPSIIASDGAEENLSVSTIEAQACGLATVASNIGGLKEIVLDNITGKLIEEKNVVDLEKSIIDYIETPGILKEHSINAKVEAKKRFDKKIVTNQVNEIYENL
jgi:colanic acid/amylovoran biosynthesis glycosyltransferase